MLACGRVLGRPTPREPPLCARVVVDSGSRLIRKLSGVGCRHLGGAVSYTDFCRRWATVSPRHVCVALTLSQSHTQIGPRDLTQNCSLSCVCTRASLQLVRARYDFAGFGVAFLLGSTFADGLVSDFFCTALCFGRGAWLGFGLFALRPGVLVAFALLPILSRLRRTRVLGVLRRRQSGWPHPRPRACATSSTRAADVSRPRIERVALSATRRALSLATVR